jgi:uncharacterized protein
MIGADQFLLLKERVYRRMLAELPSHLKYHSAEHTMEVLHSAEHIAGHEGVTGDDLTLLRVAVLYHDLGFVHTALNHEYESCALASAELGQEGFTASEIEVICGMIMATRIPQTPNTLLEQVIADADLDYLGTDKFDDIASRLYLELQHGNPNLTTERWNRIQVSFMERHQYFTEFSKKHRAPKKEENLSRLRATLPGSE